MQSPVPIVGSHAEFDGHSTGRRRTDDLQLAATSEHSPSDWESGLHQGDSLATSLRKGTHRDRQHP